ncbi:unnamed protein product [Protopolystoma xenopodis]|uniref:Uncharacterized protein n=1 Tax=Protopolystoma xenopodis TaxID=117903 RepID=A0A448X5Z8_9PLAT|nr:unnamed protein product [Protopolystoma xenopodis]
MGVTPLITNCSSTGGSILVESELQLQVQLQEEEAPKPDLQSLIRRSETPPFPIALSGDIIGSDCMPADSVVSASSLHDSALADLDKQNEKIASHVTTHINISQSYTPASLPLPSDLHRTAASLHSLKASEQACFSHSDTVNGAEYVKLRLFPDRSIPFLPKSRLGNLHTTSLFICITLFTFL